MSTPYDAIVIGSGRTGPFLAARLAAAGMRTALVEREHLGVGWGRHGVANLATVCGHARFVGPHALEVTSDNGSQVLEAPKVFINVGGHAVLPDWPGIDDVDVLTQASMPGVDDPPEHLIVIGGGYLGLECAQRYRRIGARVTVIESGTRLIAREDPDVSREVQALLEREGVRFHLGVHCAKIAAVHGGARVRVALNAGGTAYEFEGSHLLAVVGRRPNTADLGLRRAGIATDPRGYIKVDDQLRTNVEGVWALGDVNGRSVFRHTESEDHEIVVANLLEGDRRRVSDRIAAYALHTDPPLGRVGMTESEARACGKSVLAAMLQMSRIGRATEHGRTQGFMKVVVDADTERILGAALLCTEGDDIVHTLRAVMAAGASYRVVESAMHIHPTVSQLIPTLLGNLRETSHAH